ncbi:unnamed protein product [Lymnaea stagnalis]|uniref:Nck-associated protein 5 n=1 Tax=Lymnaea stagnalis TaxID=6523 RepID=A0AAV2HP83_LYMST
MMRLGTEQRLQDMQLESDSCRARLHSLQEEFRKMEDMVANMLQYKVKIDQLKQENASMKSSYENNLQKYCSHISTLERDNMMLRNQIKKIEAQVHGKGDERDKTKLLLERLKMVEAENSSLVLENEQQRQQYEKCLDEIANQVVQALLAQKTLREECLKLQSRVQDLELQNKHLNIMFKHRLRVTSDSVLQVQHISSGANVDMFSRNTSSTTSSHGEITLEFLNNAESLQSMCSEMLGDDSPGKPQLSSPPPWLRGKLGASVEGDTSPSSTSSTSTASPTTPDGKELLQTKIETEFPATNSSPKVKHISVYASRTRSLERGSSGSLSWTKRGSPGENRSRCGSETEKSSLTGQRLKQSTSADAISHYGIGNKPPSSYLSNNFLLQHSSAQDRLTPQTLLQSLPRDDGRAVLLAGADFNHRSFEAFNKNFEKLLAKNNPEDSSTSPQHKTALQPADSESTSVKSKSSTKSQLDQQRKTGKPEEKSRVMVHMKTKSAPSAALRNPFADPLKSPKSPSNVPGQYYYYDYSDEDSDSRPVSRDFSTASTMSLNELLDSSAEGEVALDDDFFSDWSSVCISPQKRIDNLTGITISNNAMLSKVRSSSTSSRSRSSSSSPESSGVLMKQNGSAPIDAKIKQAKTTNIAIEAAEHKDQALEINKTNQSHSLTSSDTVDKSLSKHSALPKPVSQQSHAKANTDSSPAVNPNSKKVTVEVHTDTRSKSFLPSPSTSPNLSQKSDHGYASKGSYSQSSPSLSPSISQRGTPPWLQSTKDSHSLTRNEFLTLVINRDAIGPVPKSVSNSSSPVQSPKLVRPGKLILAPQDKNFNFQGFSSTSSASSEDRSPLKIFESRQSSDMKSSVIEVKKDGTYAHPMRSFGESSSDNGSSASGSPVSPIKSPSKIPPPVAKKPMRAVKPEARVPQKDAKENANKETTGKYPGAGNTNLTVGFLLQDSHSFPGHSMETMDNFHKLAMLDVRNKMSSRPSSDFGLSFSTKCQSSDSSFENLKVERSGSKDDGYSTMSSDIHPEVLEKYSDTNTRKPSEADSESQTNSTIKSVGPDSNSQWSQERRNSDPTLHSRDMSFDLTSDPDSALESSIHSTAEMVTSSSSQISTSSSDYPISPCSSKVSKMARLFDVDNTQVSLIHGPNCSGQCKHKDHHSVSPSSKGSSNSNSSSPGSPNTFIPPCYQQPESPRRLANEFHKNNANKPPCSPIPFLNTSPGSPKSVNKLVGGTRLVPIKQLAQAQPQSGIPVLSVNRKTADLKVGSPTKPDSPIPVSSNIKRLPKGFYSSSKSSSPLPDKQAPKGMTLSDTANNNIGNEESAQRIVFPTDGTLVDNNKTKDAKGFDSQREENLNIVTGERNSAGKKIRDRYEHSTLSTNIVSSQNFSGHERNIENNRNSCLSQEKKDNSQIDPRVNTSVGAGHASHCENSKNICETVRDNCNSVSHSCISTSNSIHKTSHPPPTMGTAIEVEPSHHQGHPSATQLPLPSQRKRNSSCIILTNQAYQQISSDSENDDEDIMLALRSSGKGGPGQSLHDIPEELSGNVKNNLATNSNNDLTHNLIHEKALQLQNSTIAETNDSAHVNNLPVLKAMHSNHPDPSSNSIGQPQHHFQLSNIHMVDKRNSSINIRNSRCLRRTQSEQSLSQNSKSTSAYDQFHDATWDSGKVLERSTSVSELDLLHQKSSTFYKISGPAHDGDGWTLPYNQNYLPTDMQQRNLLVSPLPSQSASLPITYYQQQIPPRHASPHHQHYHPYNPWLQTLCLDLSDVTELDEDASELTSTRDSLDTSLGHNGMVSDESPRLVGDEQKRFNSQFYSLCKVDSNRSLLSSGNESKEKLSLTNLNEIPQNSDAFTDLQDVEDEIAIQEFDEIARQIAGLSKTVDELNQSLSSLNSGEFEPTFQHILCSSPQPPASAAARAEAIDGYHWVDDEFILTSCNGDIIIGGSGLAHDDSYNDIFEQSSSFDLNSTEDAREEFYQLPVSRISPTVRQDEIFAGSFFDTVKEKPLQVKDNLRSSTRNGSSTEENSTQTKKHFSNQEGNEGRGEIDGEDAAREKQNFTKEESEITESLNGSNDSDDSLASDIGLDYMMCQRLFTAKGRIHQSPANANKPVIDFSTFFIRYGDSEKEAVAAFNFLDNFSMSESAIDIQSEFKRWSLNQIMNEVKMAESAETHDKLVENIPETGVSKDVDVRETRDIGVDAMSLSQRSISTSFDTFDHLSTSFENLEIPSKLTDQMTPHKTAFTLSSIESLENINKDTLTDHETSSMKKRGIIENDELEIVSQGGCNFDISRLRSQSLKESTDHRIMSTENAPSYSEFVADLKMSSMNEPALPKLPPRHPIITNGSLHVSLERDIPPLPPPPPCLNNERTHQVCNLPVKIQPQLVLRHHAPYVNQQLPSLHAHSSRSKFNSRPLSDPSVSLHSAHYLSSALPPPLPPRQPQISRTLDGRPQVIIRPHRFHQDIQLQERGAPPFHHYLIDKSRAALSSPSPTSPGTFPRPRSHSETTGLFKRDSVPLENSKDDSAPSRIPRRKLKTRRELSKLKQSSERSSLEIGAKPVEASPGHKQRSNITMPNGLTVSGSSCDDNGSS